MSVLRFGAPPAGAREAAPAFVHGSAAAAAQMIANGNKNLVASELHGRMMRADASRGPDPEAAAARHLERFKRLKSAGDDSGAALAADAAAAHMLQRITYLEQSESAPALQARITALAREIGYDPFLEQTLAPPAKALSRAAREGRFDDVLLLARDADPERVDEALGWAAFGGQAVCNLPCPPLRQARSCEGLAGQGRIRRICPSALHAEIE